MSTVALRPHVHSALSQSEQARNRRRRAVLQRADAQAIDGVVRLDPTDREGDLLRLATVEVWPCRAMSEIDPATLTPEEVAGLAAAVADVLADLHGAGIVHGAIEPAHVLLAPGGEVTLCGFGRSGFVGDAQLEPDGGQAPPWAEPLPLDPADDIADLGRLITGLLGLALPGTPDPWAALRASAIAPGKGKAAAPLPPTGAARNDTSGLRVVDALDALAFEATDPDAAHRPTATAVASTIRLRVRDARVPMWTPGSEDPPPDANSAAAPEPSLRDLLGGSGHRPRARTRTAPPLSAPRKALAAVALLVIVVVGLPAAWDVLAGAPAGPSLDPIASGGAVPSASTTPAVPETAPPDPSPGAGPGLVPAETPTTTGAPPTTAVECPDVETALHADVDGDGCDEAVSYADGVVTVGTARFATGLSGGLATVGRFGCSGRPPTLAVLADDGRLAVFDAWASASADVTARVVGAFAGATRLSTSAGADGCDLLVVDLPSGPQTVDPRKPA